MFKNLRELTIAMADETSCRKYLADQRWPDGKAICPYCGNGKCYSIEKGKRYKCASKECYKKFSVTVGTIFEDSNIPLSKWFMAVYLASAHKKGISSYQLGKDIGVSQKCAWFMLHRIRELMRPKEEFKLDNIVEADEVLIGGSVSNMSKYKRKQLKETEMTKRIKSVVMGFVERGGDLRFVYAGKEGDVSIPNIQPIVLNEVDKDAVLITDSSYLYNGLQRKFAGHETVNHSANEYVRDEVIHTNTIEGAFSHLKRSIFGIYHKVTVKHLSRYCEETAFRYNLRKMKDADRFTFAIKKTEGRLTYKNLISSPLPKVALLAQLPEFSLPQNVRIGKQGKSRSVEQMREGKVVAE